jgi:Flp pilus assembly protein TadD
MVQPAADAGRSSVVEYLTTSRALFIIIAATVLVYTNSLSGQFVFDDTKQILGNPTIHSWANVIHAFTRDVWDFQRATFTKDIPPPYYRPLFTIYLTVGYKLFGAWEPGWHLLNLAIHTGSTVTVFFLVRRLSKKIVVATVAALCFGLHPAHVESVSWISGVPDPLAALFFVPSLIFYLRYREAGKTNWLVLSLVCYGIAALCKETALSLPLIILVWELSRDSGRLGTRITRAVKAVIPYSCVGIVYLLARFSVLGRLSWKHPMMASVPDSSILMTVPYVVATYLRHLVAPYRLSLIYGTSFIETPADPRFLVSLALLMAGAIALWVYRSKITADIWIGLTLIIAPLIPVLNLRVFHFEYIIQDRYLYLPSIGSCFLFALLIDHLVRLRPQPVLFVSALVLLGFGASTVLQNRVWHDPMALWERAIEYSPNSWSTHYNLGLARLEAKQFEAAREELLKAQSLKPSEPMIYNNLALTQSNLNELDAAIATLQQALVLDPRLFEAHNNLGTFLHKKGDYRASSLEFTKALSIDPSSIPARFNLAQSMAALGDHSSAAREYSSVIAQEPNDAAAHFQLGLSLAALNRKAEALSHIEAAISLESDSTQIAEMRKKLDELHRLN